MNGGDDETMLRILMGVTTIVIECKKCKKMNVIEMLGKPILKGE